MSDRSLRMNTLPVYRRAVSPHPTDVIPSIVRGKALHYQSESSQSNADFGISRGYGQQLREGIFRNSSKSTSSAHDKSYKIDSMDGSSSSNVDVLKKRRPSEIPHINASVVTAPNSSIQSGRLVVHRTAEERYSNTITAILFLTLSPLCISHIISVSRSLSISKEIRTHLLVVFFICANGFILLSHMFLCRISIFLIMQSFLF